MVNFSNTNSSKLQQGLKFNVYQFCQHSVNYFIVRSLSLVVDEGSYIIAPMIILARVMIVHAAARACNGRDMILRRREHHKSSSAFH